MKNILILNLLCSVLIFGQESNSKTNKPVVINAGNVMLVARPAQLDGTISGTPYAKDTFVPARINDFKNTYLVRFNAATDEMEVKSNGKDISILSKVNKYSVKLVDGTGLEYMNLNYLDNGSIKNGYFINVKAITENITLFRKQFTRYTVGKPAQTSLEQDVPSKFTAQKDKFYLQLDKTKELTEIPYSKKQFLKEFDQKELKSYLKKEKLDIKEEEDLIKVFTFYFN